jgi:hypothetical protein
VILNRRQNPYAGLALSPFSTTPPGVCCIGSAWIGPGPRNAFAKPKVAPMKWRQKMRNEFTVF